VWLDSQTPREPTIYEQVCTYVECGELPPPEVIVTKAPALLGAYGFYLEDEDVIFVLPQWLIDETAARNWVDAPLQRWIIFHEMIHYVLNFNEDVTRCESEAIARRLTSEWTGEPEDKDWRVRYGCVTDLRQMM
jgi:hypothetical protein